MSDRSAGKSARKFTDRHFPVRPNLDQLRHQAKDLLRAVKQGDPAAVAELRQHHPRKIEPAAAKLADVQAALARSYGLASWPRLVNACRMTDAIWRGDVDTVRKLVLRAPGLLHESARGVADSNWGPPMSCTPPMPGRMRSSPCCATWVPKICSTHLIVHVCRASSKLHGTCTPWGRASSRDW